MTIKTSLRIGAMTYIMGQLVMMNGIILLLPMIVSIIYGEHDWISFFIAILASVAIGGILMFTTRHKRESIRAREGFIITSFIWIFYGMIGIIPMMTCENPLNLTDAVFEIISGFTTTGASVIRDVEKMSHGILFWRAFTQWIGGLGIILLLLAVMPELNKSAGISMFNAEATGVLHSKLHPRIQQTAWSIWGVYITITLVSIFLLWIGPMDLFDSVCQTMSAIATGGFVTHNAGIQYWDSRYVEVVIIIVMYLAGLNFLILFNVGKGNFKAFYNNTVVRVYTGIIFGLSILVWISTLINGEVADQPYLPLHQLFHVIAAITSTGFGAPGVEQWGPFTLIATILLMCIGACAGSTTGGMKVDRAIVLWQNLRNEVSITAFPRRTHVVKLNGSALNNSLLTRVSAFVAGYFIIILISTGIITMAGYNLSDSLFASFSAMGCNGLGYGVTGVEGSYAVFPVGVKWTLIGMMLMGRLEIFTFLVLFTPGFWRR